MKQNILILGAGKWQCPIIKLAKKLNLYVIAIDNNPNAPGFDYADLSIKEQITDKNKILNLIRNYKINAVVTDQTEVSLKATNEIAAALNLKHLKLSTIEKTNNKFLTRNSLIYSNLNQPSFKLIKSQKQLYSFSSKIGYPLVIKPINKSSSEGVFICRNKFELRKKHFELKKYLYRDNLLIENFIEGKEYSVESFTVNNLTKILAISEKVKSVKNIPVATRLDFNFPINKFLRNKIVFYVKKMIHKLGISNGPTHTEIIVFNGKISLVETTMRGGGFGISSHIIKLTSGFDQNLAIINQSLGNEVKFNKLIRKPTSLCFFYYKEGYIRGIYGLDKIKKIKNLEKIELFYSKGDYYKGLVSDRGRLGYFIVSDVNYQNLKNTIRKIYSSVKFEIN